MFNLLKAEWIKLRSVRGNIVLCCIAAAFPIVIVVLVALLDSHPEEQSAENVIGLITSTMVVTSLLLGVIGALNLTGSPLVALSGTFRVDSRATAKIQKFARIISSFLILDLMRPTRPKLDKKGGTANIFSDTYFFK